MSAELPQSGPVLRRRNSKRTRVSLDATLESTSGDFAVELRDISRVGALIETDRPLALGSPIRFRCQKTKVLARVAWVSGCRIGLEFEAPISEADLLLHIGTGARPGLRPTESFLRSPLSREERAVVKQWERQLFEIQAGRGKVSRAN